MQADYPFGDPDGARAELVDIMDGFVGFGGHPGWGGIATRADDRTVRVIVGKKGSGKTVYLRRLQVSTRAEESVFSQTIQTDIPSTAQILRFCEICQGEQVTEKWSELWRVSILASLLSLILHKGYFAPYVTQKQRDELAQKYRGILPDGAVVHTAYNIIGFYISTIATQARYDEFINRSVWLQLRHELSELMKTTPPVFYYLDAVDEEFAHAPMEWHQCQKGLFDAVMRMLRGQGPLANRFHVAICIRDMVLSSVLRTEHASRYRGAPHICKLNWDTKRIKFFFQRKIEKLDERYFDQPAGDRNVENFLSLSKIRNVERGIDEDIVNYIIRHTRFLPRDIVELGNNLANAKITARENGISDSNSWQEVIRKLVSRAARSFANEQLTICANQLASHDRPEFSARHDYHELYTSGQEYISAKSSYLKEVIKMIGAEAFDRDALNEARTAISADLPRDVDVMSILWQNGLVGCKHKEDQIGYSFFNLDDREDFLIPDDAISFAFHSCVRDAVPLGISGESPITELDVI
ncbi:P-loop ATPase, Sll1717 family [Solirhodobacter olei]|uniref:P-loop ATPase, Sll1717 family n=1 Tax=Solirhodobacter olei TaxID=2493082 RepID=UPI000FDA078E|nr:hypothetical protein [Solirhodobacter olei]